MSFRLHVQMALYIALLASCSTTHMQLNQRVQRSNKEGGSLVISRANVRLEPLAGAAAASRCSSSLVGVGARLPALFASFFFDNPAFRGGI